MTHKDGKPQSKATGGSSADPKKTNPASPIDLDAKLKQAQAGDNRVKELEAKVAQLQQQVDKLTDTAARAQAELQNAKIRMEKEGSELRKYAAESTLKRLLPTIDNFQRAFKHLPEELKTHEWIKGITAVEQDLLRQTAEMGLKKFEALGQPVDSARHEVLMTAPGEANKVIEVLEDGYELHGKVLRPAKVKAGSGEKA